MGIATDEALWPEIRLADWRDTCATLHMWLQIVGKIRLALAPRVNHWWNTALYPTARGLTTSPMPYRGRSLSLDFDFIDHNLIVQTGEGATRALALAPRTVADFHRELTTILRTLDVEVPIHTRPSEVENPIPFELDREHKDYDAAAVNRFFRALSQIAFALGEFRARFVGKASPVHFYWGTFDLALTFYSGRRTDARAHADAITREAYTHECISFGFWPGGGAVDDAALYSYTFPEPAGLREAPLLPEAARYNEALKEFILLYEDVRRSPSPQGSVIAFCESCYVAGANLAHWDRANLERPEATLSAEPVTIH